MTRESVIQEGDALLAAGRWGEAAALFEGAVGRWRNDVELLNGLGRAYRGAGKFKEALRAFQGAALARPDLPEPLNNLGVLFRDFGDLDRASKCLGRAVAIDPGRADIWNNIGSLRDIQGDVAGGIECYDKAIALDPGFAEAKDNRLFAMHFDERFGPEEIGEAHKAWGRAVEAAVREKWRGHGNERSAGRRLRVGYLASDYRDHPVARFMLPLIREHDRGEVEVVCYSNGRRPDDAFTAQVRAAADGWREVGQMSDEAAAELVREDRIDILVELSQHSAHNRLGLMALGPAPVQVTYLAYCSTTGLSAIDYRLTDPWMDPEGQADGRFYSEETVRLPATFWCYEPGHGLEVGPLPAGGTGAVTFGCLNSFNKASPGVRRLWAEILRRVPGSRLLVHAAEGEHRRRFEAEFAAAGVGAGRVEFVGYQPLADYYGTYNRIDVALDPFPFGGGTTTCDALWMGVPLVTLRGRTAVGRGGASLLGNMGLGELIAESGAEYSAKAAGLAGDRGRMAELRAGLRGRMRGSALMDAKQFARDVEGAYRGMWRRWCGRE